MSKPTGGISKSAKIWIGVGVAALLLFMWVSGSYNGFVSGEESVKTAWSQVETQYQRRFDLVPGLVEAVRASLKQEQAVFGEIAEARGRYASGKSPEEKVAAANQLESSIARLLVIVENYPVLQSNATVQGFMAQLEGTENRVTVARERYNESVESYNIMVRRFPGNVMASIFNFSAKTRFESDKGADKAVKFNLDVAPQK